MNPFIGLLGIYLLAQPDPVRHELGVHLRAMESTLKEVTDPGLRQKAIPGLVDTTMLYFTAQFGKAAQLLDRARHHLRGETEVDPAVLWAETLAIRLTPKMVEAGYTRLKVEVTAFYPAGKAPPDAQLLLEHLDIKRMSPPIDLKSIPYSGMVDAAIIPGSQSITAKIVSGKQILATRELPIFAKKNLAKSLQALKDALEATKDKKDLGWLTLKHLESILSSLAKGEILETDYPLDRIWAQAESISKSLKAGRSWPEQPLEPGPYWIALPEGQTSRVVRILLPAKQSPPGKKLPLVLALHGAGGSENLFFDGYGTGETARQCEARGWIMASPRQGLGPKTLDQLLEILPIAPQKVMLMGHSMGAGQAGAFAAQNPQKLRATAYLGGGGRVGKGEAYTVLPAFIGIGKLDFALGSAKTMHSGMQKTGVKKAMLKEYPFVDHLTIVQIAAPDVFTLFEEALGGEK